MGCEGSATPINLLPLCLFFAGEAALLGKKKEMMQAFTPEDNIEKIVTSDALFIDVRAPVEYQKATLPGAVNLPILNDTERHLVGKRYREQGQDAAVQLGHQLVGGAVKAERVNQWVEQVTRHPNALIFCSRGGMRSQIAQQWIREASGHELPRIAGGYKAVRRYLLQRLDPDALVSRPVILGGRTGSGKTLLLQQLDNAIDLEHLANHRGSSFGHHIDPQPGQADFENRLAFALIHHGLQGHSTMVLESEGTHVGRCYLPAPLARYFSSCPLVLLEAPLVDRVELTYTEYVLNGQAAFCRVYGEEKGIEQWLDTMQADVRKIARRLGAQRTVSVLDLQANAHRTQLVSGNADCHREWIEVLLRDYYDPTYDYKLNKKQPQVIHSGNYQSVLQFLQQYK